MDEFNIKLTVTKGEASYIAHTLASLRSNLRQEIEEYGDDDGITDAHVRILNKIIPKFGGVRYESN